MPIGYEHLRVAKMAAKLRTRRTRHLRDSRLAKPTRRVSVKASLATCSVVISPYQIPKRYLSLASGLVSMTGSLTFA